MPARRSQPDAHLWYAYESHRDRRAHQLMVQPLCEICLQDSYGCRGGGSYRASGWIVDAVSYWSAAVAVRALPRFHEAAA
jgi:hypothetical protein